MPATAGNQTPTMLKAIDLSSLPSELQAELREKTGKYEGVPVNRELMQEIAQAVAGVDKHVTVGWSRERDAQGNAAYSLRLSLEGSGTGGAFRVGGGVAAAQAGSTPQRIRVGGNVQQTMLIEKVRPVYPAEAKQARIQGQVRFTAIIGKDGRVESLTVDSGHPLLVDSAMEAVKQWVYKPTLLNGEAVEVQTAIDVNYTLSQ
jgi:TonB family protein